jgi:hypothetical protein
MLLTSTNVEIEEIEALNDAGDVLRGTFGNNIVETLSDIFVSGDDYQLKQGSACIDAGYDVRLLGGLTVDMDGQERPDPKPRGRTAFDIGADEYYRRP